MGGRHGFVSALVAIAAGCSGADQDSGGVRGPGSSAQPSTTGTAGTGAAAPNDPNGFGNSTMMVAAPPLPMAGAAAEECAVGMFCPGRQPDADDCGSLTLESEVEVIEHPGNVLLVYDRSGSMSQDWNGQTRWEAAGAAIESALGPIADKLTIGSVFFPSSDPNAPKRCIDPTGIACLLFPTLVVSTGTCGVNAINATDQINFVTGPEFMTAFTAAANAAPLYAPIPDGRTPLKEGLQEAQRALAGATLTGITSVVVITDGDPNCMWDEAVSLQIVTDWLAMGINTHVIGLPGTSGTGNAILNNLATAGGTGAYITPTDAAALEQKLSDIATQTVRAGFDSCEIIINPATEAPEKLHLVVTEGGLDQDVPQELSADASWTISDDGGLVVLEGTLCDDAKSGRFEELRFEFGCVDLPPLPPTPPVQ